MRSWGLIITLFYAFSLVILLLFFQGMINWDLDFLFFVVFFMVVAQVLLMFLSVDRKFRHTKPRSHILVSVVTATFLFGLLSIFFFGSIIVVVAGEENAGYPPLSYFVIALPIIIWLIWAVLFYLYFRNTGGNIQKIVTWLLRGSVLELLVVVPSHLIVRGRNECSAPILTHYGIVTGVAIMLLAFGPSILLLYKKKLDERLKQLNRKDI